MMAQDYAQGLSRSPRPNRIPRDGDRPNADMVERERAAREAESLEGRFGRFIDSGGNWATAWRAPPAGQAVGPSPAFVAPARVVKFRTGEMALQSAPSDDPDQPTESTLIAPGQWVVRYDGDEEAAIVVNDEAFRAEMRTEEQARAVEPEKNIVQGPAVASEAGPGHRITDIPQNAPTVTPEAPAAPPMMMNVMVDHFVKLVMSDNNRLRFDCERLVRERNEAREHADRLERERDEASMRAHSAEISLSDAREDLGQRVRQGAVPAYAPPDPSPVDVPPDLNREPIETPWHGTASDDPDPVEAAIATAAPRVTGSKRRAN